MAFASDNFEMLVDLDTEGCWLWKGALDKYGYPLRRYVQGRQIRAARLIYEAFLGPIAAELTLDHLCHTKDATCKGGPTCIHRRCVNPMHQEPVTVGENSRRSAKSKRGSSVAAINARKTHCPQGHEYSPENTLLRGGKFPGRICRTCQRDWQRRHPKPRKVHEPLDCVICGTTFTPKRAGRVLCGSHRCKKLHARRGTPTVVDG